MKKSYALLAALFVVLMFCGGAYAAETKSAAPTDTVSRDYLEKELASLRADKAQKQLDDYRETTRVVLTVQGFLISLLLGGLAYLGFKVYRFNGEAKAIKNEAIKYRDEALTHATTAHKTSDEIKTMLTDLTARKDTFLKDVEEFAKQAKASEESARKSRDVAEFMSEAYRYYSAKDYQKAIEAYDKAIAVDPEWALFINKGAVLAELDRYEEAIAAYDKAIRLNSNNFLAFNNKGNSLAKLGRYEEAIEAYNEVIRLDPKSSMAFSNKGAALAKLDRYEEAIAAYDEAIRLDPKYSKAFSNKGVSLAKLGRYDEVLECHEKALKLNPNNAEAMYSMACTYSLLGRKKEMLAWLKEVIKRDAKYKKMASTDKDFVKYWDDEDFKAVIAE